jgi:hypothetical protein
LLIFNLILRRNHSRKNTDAIASFGAHQPSYSNGYNAKFPLIIGEEKLTKDYREGVPGRDPKLLLLSKIPLNRWKEFFGDIPFIFGYFLWVMLVLISSTLG